jgi:hypothetical protein
MVRRKRGLTGALAFYAILGLCTYTSSSDAAGCPNEAFRTGASSHLPDCRAYELVTPPDTNGRTLTEVGSTSNLGPSYSVFPTELASPTAPSFVYGTNTGALATPPGGIGTFDTYAAKRQAGGWVTTELLNPASGIFLAPSPVWPGGVSSDHGYSFSTEKISGKNTASYLREPDGSFQLVGLGTLNDEPYAEGRYISPGGGHVIFTTGPNEATQSTWCKESEGQCKTLPLEPKSPPEGTGAVYDRPADGPTHVVSLLPGNEPAAAGEQACYRGSSKDATSIAFELTTACEIDPERKPAGTLYVRADNGLPGERSEEVASGKPVFAGLSDDGLYLFYVLGGTIHRFDTAIEADVEVNPVGEAKVVNVSADGSHVYFICEEEIEGEGEPGKPNLYVWSGAATRYIATVLPGDLVRTSGNLSGAPALTNWTTWVTNSPLQKHSQGPGADSSRSTPDGTVLVFESRAQLTAYDNADHTEIYRYDATEDELSCVSCNSGLEPAQGDARLQALEAVLTAIIHNLSDDGSKVFFETTEALVEEDTNGSNDIYEWEAGEPPSPHLISSGKTPSYLHGEAEPGLSAANVLMSVTPDGSDVFFSAKDAQPLVPGAGENGTQGIYDARVDGGFPLPAAPLICVEEACKSAAKGEKDRPEGAASERTAGTGNLKPHKHKRRCHKAAKGGRRHKCGKSKRRKASARSSSLRAPGGTDGELGEGAIDGGGAAAAAAAAPQSSEPSSASASALAPTSACTPEFGIEKWQGSLSTAAAGMHPDFTTNLEFNRTSIGEETCEAVEEVVIHLPPGLLGNPAATPTCSIGEFTNLGSGYCPPDSQVGMSVGRVGAPLGQFLLSPVYNLTPPHPNREVARLGFIAYAYPVYIDVRVRTAGDYGVTATVKDPAGLGAVVRAKTTLWADPANPSHDEERWLNPRESTSFGCTGKEVAQGKCKLPPPGNPSGIPAAERKAFMTNPSACQEMPMGVEARSYQQPDKLLAPPAPAFLPSITECTGLPFAPSFEAEPTSQVAGAPTGLKTKLVLPQHLGEEERATATMRAARVTLPEGMQVAAGAANWIGTCSAAQIGYHEEVDAACPDSSKLGTATFVSPDLPEPIEGTIYQRSPEPGRQLGLWLASDALGLHIKLPGTLEPDKQTGRLAAVFTDLPQVPVEEIDLNVWGGPRAPLQNPDRCGSFTTDYTFTPHSDDPAVSGQSQMKITEGCNQPFSPSLKAGVTEPAAGKFSPFVFDLSRPDGDQALRGFELHLPDGELAKIAGVPLCPDGAASAGACPTGSRIGSITATTGPGPEPFTLPEPGKAQPQIYLAGPYQGSPFSIVSEVPAQAGPFDLGTLAVRSGLDVEPESGRAVVKADPLPQFFEGVGIAYRHLHAVVDRPEFNLNPTDCSELQVSADAASTQGAVAHPAARFQVDGCRALKFKPKLSLKLKGGTERAQYPALTAILKTRKGDANIDFTSVALPHSEFLAQEHIDTICTRVQFAADKCPNGSVYGRAKAITPLLDAPLAGNVYLRSSNHPLPDLVAKLGGQLEIDLVGRIDTVHGGIRATFESVPDAPVSKFVLQMRGGKKSLLTNSTDICSGAHRATVRMKAQNGRVAALRPRLLTSGCGRKKPGKQKETPLKLPKGGEHIDA